MSYNLSGKDFLIVCSFIWILIRVFSFFLKKKHFSYNLILNELLYFSLMTYCSMAIGLTIFPLRFGSPIVDEIYLNLIPFSSSMYEHIYVMPLLKNIIGNFLLLFPLGFYIPLLSNVKKVSMKRILFIGLLTSCSIEIIQLLTNILRISGSTRMTDINDIILNTLGIIVGYFIYSNFFSKFLKELFNRK